MLPRSVLLSMPRTTGKILPPPIRALHSRAPLPTPWNKLREHGQRAYRSLEQLPPHMKKLVAQGKLVCRRIDSASQHPYVQNGFIKWMLIGGILYVLFRTF